MFFLPFSYKKKKKKKKSSVYLRKKKLWKKISCLIFFFYKNPVSLVIIRKIHCKSQAFIVPYISAFKINLPYNKVHKMQ